MSAPSHRLWPDSEHLGPATDLYQLTMMAGYAAAGIDRTPATFEMFVRRLPPGRAYLVLAGLEQAIRDVEHLRFSRDQIDVLRRWPVFAQVAPEWFDRLADFRFTGEIWSVPEGSVVFPAEPLIRVSGPLAEAQLVETYLLSAIGYPTLVATKAARMVQVAGGRKLYEFGARRGHGPHAAYLAARAAYLAGFAGTSHVDSAIRLGIPCVGTMAHAWIQAFGDESEAFRRFASVYPSPTLLVDTYDTPTGVRRAAEIEPPVAMVRIDSGDLAESARETRRILDECGRTGTRILGSGDLDEFKIRDLLAAGAPYDAFGVGTELITSRDAPALSIVYKLVEMAGQGRVKLSSGKKTYPLAKQVYRRRDANGKFTLDYVTKADEVAEGEPLLRQYIRKGEICTDLPTLDEIRAHCRAQLDALPDSLRALEAEPQYPLDYSEALEDEARRLGVKV